MPTTSTYKQAYEKSPCHDYGSNGLLLFALSLRFNIDDIDSLAANCLTEGSDDKKIDALLIDEEELGTAVIVQSYESADESKSEAPANKASDLNTAVTWAFNQPIEEVPERIRSDIVALRDAIGEGKISNLEFWYVHNLHESKNVNAELKGVEASANSALTTQYPDSLVNISAFEVGSKKIEEWFLSQSENITITDDFRINVSGGYASEGPKWRSYSTAIPAKWLYSQYQKYGASLFSANIRGYLGSRRSDRNINAGIKNSCEHEPDNFWVYNNGITCLVHNFTAKNGELNLQGLAIVNGAQTTGAIGSISKEPEENAFVPTRFIMCRDKEVLQNIIRFNNSQNKISAADFRSNDPIQKRLRDEFQTLPNTEYRGRRGGAEDVIRRTPNLLSSDTVAQSLAAAHGDPILAYDRKSQIWEKNENYSKFFNSQTSAEHIVFAYSLKKALEQKKRGLIEKEEDLIGSEKEQLSVLRNRGSMLLLVSAISECLEIFLDRKIPNLFRISFGKKDSKTAIEYWNEIIEITLPFSGKLMPALEGGLKNYDKCKQVKEEFKSLVLATRLANKQIIDNFREKIVDA